MLHNQFTKFLLKDLIGLVFPILFSCQLSYAQVFEDQVFREKAAAGMDLVNQQRNEEAEVKLEQLLLDYPEHPAPHFLLAANRWWQSYITTSPNYHAYIAENLDKALALNKEFEKKLEFELEYTFFQYMCYAFKTRLHTLRREWL